MGWQTTVLTEEYFNRQTYNNKSSIENEIEDIIKSIEYIKDTLLIYSTSRPSDILLNNDEDSPKTLFDIRKEVMENLEYLEENIINKYKLQSLLENFDLRNGDFIDNPHRRHNIKQWLLDNYILKPEDLNMDINDDEKSDK